jgi:hypothetical protein
LGLLKTSFILTTSVILCKGDGRYA